MTIPRGLATAALLKSQLDQGKDYFDLLLPFINQAIAESNNDPIQPQEIQRFILAATTLDVPLRTVGVLLDRAARRGLVRKEYNAYIKLNSNPAATLPSPSHSKVLESFLSLGAECENHLAKRGSYVSGPDGALTLLCAFLENHASEIVLEGLSHRQLTRQSDLAIAAFIAKTLGEEGESAAALLGLLQGLILARTVMLEDLAQVSRRLDGLVVYFDTPFLLALAGLYGELDLVAAREGLRLIRATGVTTAAFDVTLTELRRILAVYEARIDSATGRESLYPNSLTTYLFAVKATGAEVLARSALLEKQLTREGLVVHETPRREREFVHDEAALAAALKDVRGPGFEAREQHDVDCVAAILTLRRGQTTDDLSRAKAVFAAHGRVVSSVRRWWHENNGVGLAPVIQYSSLLNACWLKQPTSGAKALRFEMAAICAHTLSPTPESWALFRQELQKMVSAGAINTDEAAAILIDSFAAKLVVESEDEDSVNPGRMVDIIRRVREDQHREVTEMRVSVERERELFASQLELERASGVKALIEQEVGFKQRLTAIEGDLEKERLRSDSLTRGIEAVARFIGGAVYFVVVALIGVVVVTLAVFPNLEDSGLTPRVLQVAKVASVLLTVGGGVWGFAVVPFGKNVRQRVEKAFVARLSGGGSPPPQQDDGA